MLTNYFTLRALVREWAPDLAGCAVADAFSQVRDELTLALEGPAAEWMLRLSTQAPLHFLFRTEGYSKARRNVATLFEDAFGRRVAGVRIAERDRMLYLDLDGGGGFQVQLFGPRANVFLVGADGLVREAFQADAEWAGREAPAPRPAPRVETWEAFEGRWKPSRRTTSQALASAVPLFDRTLAAEVLARAGVDDGDPAGCTEAERRRLFEEAVALRAALEAPEPRIYWKGAFADEFALVPLRHLAGTHREEAFETVDRAVAVFVRRALGQRRFRSLYEPLDRALGEAADYHRRQVEHMLEALTSESRADRYERWGHLLMAAAADVPERAEEVELPDLFADGAEVTIPLDPALTAVENAEVYYDKARRTRQARAHAEDRLLGHERQAEAAEALHAELQACETLPELERFLKEEAARLAPFTDEAGADRDGVPFRRYALPEGYEVWVGRNAKQNDLLTFRHAQKYDLWMHARGVPGSHAVLRLRGRDDRPGPHVVERAAAVAAYYSKARGSHLVPVMVVPRKYVRKPKGAALGAVVVEREEVVLVEPGLPSEA